MAEINTAAIAAIYRRAAAIAADATTQDIVWWDELAEETDFLLREARGEVTRSEGCSLPSLASLIG